MHLASDEFGQSAWQKFHGYSGPMLHGRAGSALCIGYGSGESAACLVRYGLQRVDCVEISPEVVETAARFFGHINAGVRPGERARIILMDGRNYLHLTGETYDLILSDPINPLFAENAALYTEEFFRSARDRLRPQGLFLCWLPVYLPEDAFESILATAARAFAHVTLWAVPGSNDAFLQVVCSRDPQRFSPARVGAAFSARPVASDLARLGIDSGHAFLAYYRGDERGVRKYAKRARINSDRMPVVEFTTRPMLTGLRARVLVSRLLRTTHDYSLGEHLDWQGFSDDERRQWQSEFELRQRAQSRHAAWPRQPSAP
jgi:SAM-dependent methyltransferase